MLVFHLWLRIQRYCACISTPNDYQLPYVNPWHILSSSPCSPLPQPAQGSSKDSYLAGYFANITKTPTTAEVYNSLLFSFRHFPFHTWLVLRIYIVTMSNSQSPASNVINKIHINTAKSRIRQSSTKITYLVSFPFGKHQVALWKINAARIEYSGIKLRPESMFDTGSSMTFNRLQWYQVISVAISGYFIHMTEYRWEKNIHNGSIFKY